jgi:two-component system chemotaxis sensor kinase CheA
MGNIDIAPLLNEFKNEAGTHLEIIESAFLNAGSLKHAPELMDRVFRAAHSIKGTASFFSLQKIVAVSHELESVFTRIRDGVLNADEDLTDAVLDGVGCLKELTGGNFESYDIEPVIARLKKYSIVEKKVEAFDIIQLPFPFPAVKRGHFIYYITIPYNAKLEKYYRTPFLLLREISSVGTVLKVRINGEDFAVDSLTDKLLNNAELELLVTSILEPELFYIATDIDGKYIRLVSNEQNDV